MNLPDITLLFQMVHFIMAYWVLRHFIFAPALAIINEQQQKNKSLLDKVLIARGDLKGNLEQQQQRWSFIRQSLMKMSPSIAIQKCLTKLKVTSPIEITKTKISQAEKDSIQKMLHEKLLDV